MLVSLLSDAKNLWQEPLMKKKRNKNNLSRKIINMKTAKIILNG